MEAPEDIVLTTEQYSEFSKSPSREYWRDSLLSVLKMVDVVIFGYSAKDPDIQEQLERAKQIASPDHPVFMFAADFDLNTVRELYQKYNIRVIPYRNGDGTHRELQRLLARYDPFIAKRGSHSVGLGPVDESAATLASSIYLFTKLRVADEKDCVIEKSYEAVIAQTLFDSAPNAWMSLNTLRDLLAKKTFATSNVDPAAFQNALDALYSQGMISISTDQSQVLLEPRGRDVFTRLHKERDILREQFQVSCKIFLDHEYPNLREGITSTIIQHIEVGLVNAFQKRGMEIARSVFQNGDIDVSDATDILQVLNEASASLVNDEDRSAYADLMIEVMLKPNEEMRDYLAAISQGYFAFHALGLEPRCSQERLNMAREKLWILDSSMLLPLLASHCLNSDYALDLLNRMKQMGLRCVTTERLFEEVREHAWWAFTNFSKVPPDSPILFQAASAGIGYKQNLFLDGFMKWSLTQGNPTFDQYMSECLGTEFARDLYSAIRNRILALGIEIIHFQHMDGFSQEMLADRDACAKQIENLRRQYGT